MIHRLTTGLYLISKTLITWPIWKPNLYMNIFLKNITQSQQLLYTIIDAGRWASLQWHHNGRDSVSNHQPHDCLLNRLFGRRSKRTWKLRVTGLCAGNSPGPVNSPHKGPVTRKMFPFDDVIMVCTDPSGTIYDDIHYFITRLHGDITAYRVCSIQSNRHTCPIRGVLKNVWLPKTKTYGTHAPKKWKTNAYIWLVVVFSRFVLWLNIYENIMPCVLIRFRPQIFVVERLIVFTRAKVELTQERNGMEWQTIEATIHVIS